MTREDVIRMAREAGFPIDDDAIRFQATAERVTRFAALVAAHERNRTWTQDHWTEYERSIAAAEREECAKVCEGIDREYDGEDVLATWCAAAIRARGQGCTHCNNPMFVGRKCKNCGREFGGIEP